MSILLTGGSGFIGRNVIKALLKVEQEVVAFSRSSIDCFAGEKNLVLLQGDLATGEGLEQIPWERIESVIHLAAAGVKSSKRAWEESIQVNILGTERLLQAIKKEAVKHPKVFLAKTFYEKALHKVPAFKENPYIVTKEAASRLAAWWSEGFGGTTIFGTIYHTFGPDDDPDAVLSYAARQFKAGQTAIFSSGRALGDWLYIDDVVIGILTAINASHSGVTHWDIGSGSLTTIRDLVERLHQISGHSAASLRFDPSLDRTGTPFQEAAEKLPPGFQPQWSLQGALEEHYQLIENI